MEEADRRILAFIGAHRFVLATQIERFLESDGTAMRERLSALQAQRLVRLERLHTKGASLVRITGGGLLAIGSRLPAPGFEVTGYRHEIGIVWLWVAAWQGAFGEVERVLSRREMQTLDRAMGEVGDGDGRFAVPVTEEATTGGRLYPDVMMVFRWGRVALHLVSWPHRHLDCDVLFAGHQLHPEVADAVLCLVDDETVGRRMKTAADRRGLAEKVRWQLVVGDGTARPRTAS